MGHKRRYIVIGLGPDSKKRGRCLADIKKQIAQGVVDEHCKPDGTLTRLILETTPEDAHRLKQDFQDKIQVEEDKPLKLI